MIVKITWIECNTYDQAKNFTEIIYLHEWNEKPFYWGICLKTFFGGSKRLDLNGKNRHGRYGPSYKHWIEGCLQHGAKLYVGQVSEDSVLHLNQIENYLIKEIGSCMNSKTKICTKISLEHEGNVPMSIQSIG